MCPAIIGTAVPRDHTGKRLAVSIGDTLIDSGAAAPAGNEQIIQLPASSRLSGQLFWNFGTNRPAIIDGLKESASDTRFLLYVELTGAQLTIGISPMNSGRDSTGADLSSAFETMGQVIFEGLGQTITINTADYSDDSEPYVFNWKAASAANAAAAAVAAANAVSTGAAWPATLTLRDYTK